MRLFSSVLRRERNAARTAARYIFLSLTGMRSGIKVSRTTALSTLGAGVNRWRGTNFTVSASARLAMAAVIAPYSGVFSAAHSRFATSSCTITTKTRAFSLSSISFMMSGVVM